MPQDFLSSVSRSLVRLFLFIVCSTAAVAQGIAATWGPGETAPSVWIAPTVATYNSPQGPSGMGVQAAGVGGPYVPVVGGTWGRLGDNLYVFMNGNLIGVVVGFFDATVAQGGCIYPNTTDVGGWKRVGA